MGLIAELRRRNVIRMAGLYLVGAWLLVQVAGTVLPWFNVSASMLIRPMLWKDENRGKLPIGWTVSPAMMDLCPDVLGWFYEQARGNDYFVTGCSGFGYVMGGFASAMKEPKRPPCSASETGGPAW